VCENSLLFLIGFELLLQKRPKIDPGYIFMTRFLYFCNKSVFEEWPLCQSKDSIARWALSFIFRVRRRQAEYGIINLFILRGVFAGGLIFPKPRRTLAV